MPNKAFASLVTNIPFDQNQIFEGHLIGPDNFPTRYLSKYLYITTPTVVLICFLLFFIFFRNAIKSLKPFSIFIFIYTFMFCINRVKTHYMNPDTLWAIHYCIYPLFMLIAASGLECTLRQHHALLQRNFRRHPQRLRKIRLGQQFRSQQGVQRVDAGLHLRA